MGDVPAPPGAPSRRSERELLAQALAAHLRHRQRYRALRYLPGAALPSAREPAARFSPAPAAVQPAAGRPERPPAAADLVADRAIPVPPGEPLAPPTGPLPQDEPRGDGPKVPPDDPRRWPPARKLEYLRVRVIGDCHRCGLCRGRTQIVFGVGRATARIMFVGEGPGAEEDRRGEPFVGRAGQRLDRWLAEVGLARSDVYIANVVKCRPPNNRDPTAEEIRRCAPFLAAQIRAVAPALVIALGRIAAGHLLGTDQSLSRLRGRALSYVDPGGEFSTALAVTYHPAYVLRREREAQDTSDRDAVADLRQALARLER